MIETKKVDPFFLNSEWFFDLAEKLILQERGNYKALNGIHSVKYTTRKETLRRLSKGKDYMDELFLQNPDITDVASSANMSEFHFYRVFRQAYNITPYQYMLSKRLEYAIFLLKENQHSFSSIASLCGFPNLSTFSKAVKRKYDVPPSKILELLKEKK
jgi:AraC-like DNA-binding protein